MGFECVYHYHEKLDKDYNKEEVKTFKKKVGDPFEDVPLEKLAVAVMAQLARRDVWIIDVEVFELSKKQISFKESKGGIILKNKKFLFDGGGEDAMTFIVQDISPALPSAQPYKPASGNQLNVQGQSLSSVQPHEQNVPRRPIDWVVFAPEIQMMSEIRQKNLKFTNEKRYPVFQKQISSTGIGEIFVVIDDTGREQLISDKYFVPAITNLFADKELGFSQGQKERDGGKLLWGSANMESDMPDIRRK